MGRREDLETGTACLGFEQLEQKPETAGMDAVLDLLDCDDTRHVGLKEGGGDGREPEGSVGEDRGRKSLITFLESEKRLSQRAFKDRNVVKLNGCKLPKPGQVGRPESIHRQDRLHQRSKIFASFS